MQMWIANSFVIATSVVLFLLWFRYVCSLLLAAQTSLDCSDAVARANSLAFADILRQLNSVEVRVTAEEVDGFASSLQRDFEVVSYLLRHMGESPLIDSPAEALMLRVDYRIQSLCFRTVRLISAAAARNRVNQMASIICHFADLIGVRSVPARV